MIIFQWNFQIRTTTFVYHVLASWGFHFWFAKMPNAIFILSKWIISWFPVSHILKILGKAPLKIHESLEGAPHYPVSLKLFWKESLKSYSSLNKYPQNPGTFISLEFHSKFSKLSRIPLNKCLYTCVPKYPTRASFIVLSTNIPEIQDPYPCIPK